MDKFKVYFKLSGYSLVDGETAEMTLTKINDFLTEVKPILEEVIKGKITTKKFTTDAIEHEIDDEMHFDIHFIIDGYVEIEGNSKKGSREKVEAFFQQNINILEGIVHTGLADPVEPYTTKSVKI